MCASFGSARSVTTPGVSQRAEAAESFPLRECGICGRNPDNH